MIYALRKLIAFVFLGGMFWFIYQDLGNLGKPWFMHALGLIAIVFAFFWLLIPMVVVWFRIRRRRIQNQIRYRKWLAEGGVANIGEHPARNARLDLEPDEQACFHEKGTLYVEKVGRGEGEIGLRPLNRPSAFKDLKPRSGDLKRSDLRIKEGKGDVVRPVGRPSDVAFPRYRRDCHVCQRTHCYMTTRRLAFAGKGLDIRIPWEELKKYTVMPGGIVFESTHPKQNTAADGGMSAVRFAFTFQNPLVVADILKVAKGEMMGR